MVHLERILHQFEISENISPNFHQDGKNGLSFVYFVDKKYVLRGRPIVERTLEDYLVEREVLQNVSPLISPIYLPEFIPTKSGEYCVIDDGVLWTFVPFIPGTILSGISDVSVLLEADKELLIRGLYDIQTQTKNLKQADSHYRFTAWVGERYLTIQKYFSPEEQGIIRHILSEIEQISLGDETCFVHGDYHPGNILVNEKHSSIIGLVDLDWCHVGSFYEDLSLIVLTFIRDISQAHFVYDENTIRNLVNFYPGKIDLIKLKKYILLRSIHDQSIFIPRTGGWMRKMENIQDEIIKSLFHNLYT